jgi:Fe-S-cluster containining protein
MDINFQCTKCGDCCRGMWIGLSVGEAMSWLDDGHTVQVFCEAVPWPDERPADDLGATYKRERSFPSKSGNLPIRVIVTLVAPQGGRCPNLSNENICTIYYRRPLTCRIYPAEKIPFIELSPARRKCPENAWQCETAPYVRAGSYVDKELRNDLRRVFQRSIDELQLTQSLCDLLNIREAALSNEGYVVHTPSNDDLRRALCQLESSNFSNRQEWLFVSDQPPTEEAIVACGALLMPLQTLVERGKRYLSLIHQ